MGKNTKMSESRFVERAVRPFAIRMRRLRVLPGRDALRRIRNRIAFVAISLCVAVLPRAVKAEEAALQPDGPGVVSPARDTWIHSHNDYAQKRPFWGAYEAGADSIEADVFLVDGELLVAHSRKGLKKENTLRRLYLEPLREVMRRNGGHARADGRPLQLVIDLKDGKPALDALVTMIEREGFRRCFEIGRNPSAVRLSVGGDISRIKDFLAYPDFVFFSVPSSRKLDGGQYKRVSWISDHAHIYTKWRSGAMAETDKEKIRDAARRAHAKGVPYRLWGFPDHREAWELALELGLDYINTDHPAAAASFLRGKNEKVRPPSASSAEYFVATNGCDTADGSAAHPWRTIQRAADVAVAGDTVTIRGGVYREWVKPANAGREDAPIVYRAAKGEKVVVTGADPVTGWTRRPDGLWMAKVRYDRCLGMNPFKDVISGDWFNPRGKQHLRSWVIQDGKALETHHVSHLWGQNANGDTPWMRQIVDVSAIHFGKWKLPGAGRKRECESHVCRGLGLTVPENRDVVFESASESCDVVVAVFDADAPRELLGKVRLPATGSWSRFVKTPFRLPDSAAKSRNLRFCFYFAGETFRYGEAARLVPKGHAVLVPGAAAGRIIAAFEKDPNVVTPELVTRPACFYPPEEHCDYIVLRGIAFRNAAPDWGTANGEQLGVVGTHWSRGWTIEDCEVSGSPCDGITLGKHGDEWDNAGPFVERYYATIRRAASNGWDRVGHHVVRRCKVFDCGQTGIHSSLGAPFSTIEDCEIFHCNWKKPYSGWDMAGLKLLCSVGVTIRNNRIHHNGVWAGIWLDWMAQGVRVTGNRLWANEGQDLFVEVDHGPVLVEGNDFLSPGRAVQACSQGVAFVGNRMLGGYQYANETRCTPVFKPHSVELESVDEIPCGSGGHVFINNILAKDPRWSKELFPSRHEDNWTIPAECWQVDESTGDVRITPPAGSKPPDFKPVDAKRLGRPVFVDQAFPEPSVIRPKER